MKATPNRGIKLTDTASRWPSKACTNWQVSGFHSLIDLSLPPDARNLSSLLKARLSTSFVWPLLLLSVSLASFFRIVLSFAPV